MALASSSRAYLETILCNLGTDTGSVEAASELESAFLTFDLKSVFETDSASFLIFCLTVEVDSVLEFDSEPDADSELETGSELGSPFFDLESSSDPDIGSVSFCILGLTVEVELELDADSELDFDSELGSPFFALGSSSDMTLALQAWLSLLDT